MRFFINFEFLTSVLKPGKRGTIIDVRGYRKLNSESEEIVGRVKKKYI